MGNWASLGGLRGVVKGFLVVHELSHRVGVKWGVIALSLVQNWNLLGPHLGGQIGPKTGV